jgi:anthranilate phosphoribosyltransferase
MTLLEAFKAVMAGRDLTENEAYEAMMELMSGDAAPELISGFIVVMRYKQETIPEITGFARAMRQRAIRIQPKVKGRLIDTCGTGGASVKSFNISTASAFVAAAAGAAVAKHGNKSITRPSGSADVLASLGANLSLAPTRVEELIEDVGVGFLLAPNFHPAMKNAAPTRNTLQIRTVFNVLGPLTNPAGASGQVLGVFDEAHVEPMAQVLQRLGSEHSLVIHGEGMDEANLAGTTHVCEVRDGWVRRYTIQGRDYGYPAYQAAEWGPLSPAESAREIRKILGGKVRGARRDIVEYNAGLAIYVGGVAKSIGDGILRAREVLETDLALKKLDEFAAATKRIEVSSP